MMARRASGASFGGVPRVNLMPRAELERRARMTLVRRWSWGLVAAVTAVAVAIGATFALQLLAAQRLDAERARTAALLTELAALADVNRTFALRGELEGFRADAMAAHLLWTPLWERVAAALPPGASLVGFEATVVAGPEGDGAVAGPSGTITIASEIAVDLGPAVRSLREIEGIADIDGREIATERGRPDDPRYTYVLDVSFDETVYSGAFAAEEEGEG